MSVASQSSSPGAKGRSRAPRGNGWFARNRTLALLLSLAVAAALLSPILLAPVNSDDRYWYPMIGFQTGGSFVEAFRWAVDAVSWQIERGRFTPLSDFVRASAQMAAMEASIRTGWSVVVFHGLTRVVVLVLAIGAVLLMVRNLRWRASDGRLLAVSSGALWYLAIALPVLIAAGVQSHLQFRNGWTTFPILSYSSAVLMFGSVAFVLWVARLAAGRSPVFLAAAAASAALLALATTNYFEMVLPVGVVSVAALVVTPITPADSRAAGLRAKAIIGGAYAGSFVVALWAIRRWLDGICADQDCYAGVVPSLGVDFVRTSTFNVLSTLPVFRENEIRADLSRVGLEGSYPIPPTWGSALLALLAVGVLLWAWSFLQGPESAPDRGSGEEATTEACALLLGAGVALLIGFGAAAVMGLSVQAQTVVTEPGVIYRNAMVTWTALASAAALLLGALTRISPSKMGRIGVVASAAMLGLLIAASVPPNWAASRSHQLLPSLQASEAILRELALGDSTDAGNARRCAALDDLEESVGAGSTRTKIILYSDRAFEMYHGSPFCRLRG